jgi:drug/metabolite transporter (DMT)-like permease
MCYFPDMPVKDSDIAPPSLAQRLRRNGLAWGLLGVVAFSFTVPLTRVAVSGDAMSPLFVGAGRAVIAAVLAAVALAVTRQTLPTAQQWARIAVVAGGVVVGFPLLTSYALTSTPASHGAVVIALLPAATAITVVLRTGEHPPRQFWTAAVLGMIVAVGFASVQGGGLDGLHRSDLLLFGAVLAAAIGYAEGGLMAQQMLITDWVSCTWLTWASSGWPSPISQPSACFSGSSPGTADLRSGPWPKSARCS